jgi:hypothetical protein
MSKFRDDTLYAGFLWVAESPRTSEAGVLQLTVAAQKMCKSRVAADLDGLTVVPGGGLWLPWKVPTKYATGYAFVKRALSDVSGTWVLNGLHGPPESAHVASDNPPAKIESMPSEQSRSSDQDTGTDLTAKADDFWPASPALKLVRGPMQCCFSGCSYRDGGFPTCV